MASGSTSLTICLTYSNDFSRSVSTDTVDALKLTIAFLMFLSLFNFSSIFFAQLAQSRFLILYLYFIDMFLSYTK